MVLQHYLPIRCLLATAVLPSLLVGPVAELSRRTFADARRGYHL